MSDTLFTSSDGIDPEVVEAARAELAKKLPELRKLPGFPIGSDEDILKMSVPPYYTACPNPFIEDWLEASAPDGYEDREYVDPGPFTSDVSAGKTHPIYRAHSYWTKVPHEIITRYVLHYTRPGDVVLDGFAGSGMTGVAAQACGAPEPMVKSAIEAELGPVEWGARRAVLQDLAPVASFIAAGLNLPIDAEAFDAASQRILDEFEVECGWMYETTHTDGSKARIDYTVWSEVFTCPSCGSEIVFYDVAFSSESGKVLSEFECDSCGALLTKTKLERRLTVQRTIVGDNADLVTYRPIRIAYRARGHRFERAFDESDQAVLDRINRLEWEGSPAVELPVDQLWHGYNFGPRGFSHLHHLFIGRSLASLTVLWRLAESESDPGLRLSLLFWVEQAIWGLSLMNRYKPSDYSQVNRYQTGVFYMSSLVSECSPHYNLEGSTPARGKRSSLSKVWRQSPSRVRGAIVSTGSTTNLQVPSETVDYVFVDPPFGLNIPYADLNLLVENFHSVVGNNDEEAVVHRVRGVGIDEYASLLAACFSELFRVLKPGRWMTVVFSNSSNEVWMELQGSIQQAGFAMADTRILDKQQGSWIQVRRPNAVKRDIVISAYKPSSETEERFTLVAGTPEGAWEFVSGHLSHLPVVEGKRGVGALVRERFADRLYDRMVAYHVHRSVSVPLTAAEFYLGLEQRFPVRDDMYFLSEQVEEYERHRMTFKDLAQLEMFITGEASAVQWLRQLLKKKSRAYAEIQPLFFDELQAGLPEWEELPELRELLEESFLQDDQDRWFVPDPKKSVDLEAQRTTGLLREFETYVSGKGKLSSFRSEAVRAGFKDAWGRRDFMTIVTVGERLPVDVFVEDEALLYYYDNARRLLPEAN